jgi:phosphoribosyl 1,2-cyclic phosphate phosphodiesterase
MTSEVLTVTILGSGTSTGVPVIGCACAVCSSPDPRDQRTRCSALLSFRGRNVIIDTATDLRQQMLREKVTHIDAVLYTHIHADHVHGIDDLRVFNSPAGDPIPVFGSAETIAGIRRNFPYIFHDHGAAGFRPRLEAHEVSAPFDLFGVSVEPVPLRHGPGTSFGYRIGPVAYLVDCSAIPPEAESRLRNLDLLVIDALRFRPHDSHLNVSQAIEVAARLQPRRTLLTHLTHEVAHRRDSSGLPDGVELAYDGQRIEVSLASSAARLNAPF